MFSVQRNPQSDVGVLTSCRLTSLLSVFTRALVCVVADDDDDDDDDAVFVLLLLLLPSPNDT